jgi:2-haloacid dehalogenase/putative hydrolase of the HAD superfamily
MTPVVTFDLFSALLDSRAGGSAAFDTLARDRGWAVRGEELYDGWDARNKAAQRDCAGWVPWREPAVTALATTYADRELSADPAADVEVLVASMPAWPTWPDVANGLPRLAPAYRVGLLSNVDDDLFERTAAAPLVDPEVVLTSQRLRAYKPHSAIYRRARSAVGPMVHVATSGRDVRGALEAGIPVVRLRRPGHGLDPDGPRPTYEVETVDDLPHVLPALLG